MEKNNYIELYSEFLKKHIKLKKPLKVVADSSNGTAGLVLKTLTNVPNLELILINDTPSGDFPAHGPNPLIPGAELDTVKQVLETKADIGVIFDADADRAFFVDNTGRRLSSFRISILLFKANKPPYVADETVFKSLEHMKIFNEKDLVPSKVGSFFVKQKLKEVHASTAAEFSGHYYFKEFFGADSGIFTMIQVLNILSELDTSLSEFILSLSPQYVKNDDIKLGEKKWSDVEPKVRAYAEQRKAKIETREGITLDFGDSWVNMRPSNTEPLLRLIAGGRSREDVAELIGNLYTIITSN